VPAPPLPPITGDYLVQVWGGKGGAGTDYVSPGGKGGAGGYVYGVVHLTAGETLYYQLGGDGQQTAATDEGGGINGDGGHHGDTGSMLVGGGGGYSVVYKFAPQEFERKYTDGAGNQTSEISDEDRATKYILIAGGGGGGGAGNGNSPLLGITATGTADGGAGGSVGSTSGVLSGSGYDVEGTFFAGENGKSSGPSTNYVGRGATNVPGAIEGTALGSLIGLFNGKEPNDWRGTNNANYSGGGGGSGNLRGGAGGAGFCGGSGGVQSGLLSPTYVGGGGGGSSFIASTVTYTGIDSILAASGKTGNPSSTGGGVYICALESDELSYLSDLTLTAQISPYFTVAPQPSTYCTVSFDPATNGLTVSGVDLISNPYLRLELQFTPVSGFAGGNDIPLWNGGFTCTSNVDSSTVLLPVSDQCGYVNLPLTGFTAKGQSIDSAPADERPVSALKGSNYEGWAGKWMYAGIQNISDYTVDPTGDPTYNAGSQTVAPVETTYYPISVTVTPKPNLLAVVGTQAVEKIYHGKSAIKIGANSGTLNGNAVTYSKHLSYNSEEQRYELKLNTSITTDPAAAASNESTPFTDTTAVVNGVISYDSHLIPASGYYYIQAWGASGGTGGTGQLGGNGGSGANGGYVAGWKYFEQGETVYFVVGSKGANANQQSGGSGGGASGISSTNTTNNSGFYLVAGGGGGGACGAWGQTGNSAAENNSQTSGEATVAISGYNGGNGSYSILGGSAGASKASYHSTNIIGIQPTGKPALTTEAQAIINTLSSDENTANPNAANGNGAVRFTLIQQVYEEQASIADYFITAQLSDYFVLNGAAASNVVFTGLAEGNAPTVTYTSIDEPGDNVIAISNLDPYVTDTEADGEHVFSAEFTVTLYLNPRDGFLGGNDVPLLKPGADSMRMQYQQADAGGTLQTLGIAANPETDYANVVINPTNGWTDAVTPTIYSTESNPKTITAGDTVAHSELYNKAALETKKSELEAAADWRDDFVNFTFHLINRTTELAESDDPLYPPHTTYYNVVLALEPKESSPNATCVAPPVTGITEIRGETLVKVLPRIIYQLTDLVNSDKVALATTNGTIKANVDYTATLSPGKDYALPGGIAVTKREGSSSVTLTAGTDYTYNAGTGVIFISAAVIGYSEITIIATAEKATFTLNYIYQTSPTGAPIQGKVTGLCPGDSLLATLPHTHAPANYAGYEFQWSWEYGDGSELEQMPAADVWVMGSYVPREYTLTIHYTYAVGGGTAAPDHVETVKYGSAYSVTSPTISGYMPDQAVVSGTMPANHVTVTVTYTGTANQLNILYFKEQPDGTLVQFDSYRDDDVATGTAYSVTSPAVDGYTVESGKEVISGTMVTEGVTAQVIYRPNTFAVTIDPNGGSCTTAELTAVYDNIYGYDPEASGYTTAGGYAGLTAAYRSLPTPVRIGFDFEGWYLDKDVWAQPVKEDTSVSLTAGHTLYAKWKGQTFSYTIKHVYDNGLPVNDGHLDYTNTEMTVGMDIPPAGYDAIPVIDTYTADKVYKNLEGTMPAQNVVVTITYTSNFRHITIQYLYANNVKDETLRGKMAHEPHTGQVEIGKEYNVTSPIIPGYTPSEAEVTVIMGTTDVEITVFYYDDNSTPVVAVTVTWGSLSFRYTHGEWDPQTHTYSTEPVYPVTAGTNYVMVTNNAESEINVNASFAYAANSGFEGLTHYFTATDNRNAATITQSGMLAPGGVAAKAFLWLQGTLPTNMTGNQISGVCTVTITGGG